MSKTRRIIAAAVAIYLLAVLFDGFVLVKLFFARTGIPILIAAFEAVALIGCGFAVRGLIARRWDPAELNVSRDLLVGYPIFGAACFLVGTLNVSGWSMGALLVIAGVGGLYAIVRRFEIKPLKLDVMPTIPIAVVAVMLAAVFLAQAPPSTLDELAYHLAVPWTWVKEGRAVALPLLSHSYFPLGIESADLPLLSMFGSMTGGLASHFLHLFAAFATAAVAHELTRKSALGTAAIITTPALAICAGWSLVDWPLAGICLTAFGAVEDGDDALLAASLGAALLTKYTFVPFAIILVLATRRWRWRIIVPALVIGSIFFLRNVVIAGNPIAPFLSPGAPHVNGYRAPYLSDYIFDGKFIDESLGVSLLALMPLTGGFAPVALAIAALGVFFLGPSSRILLPFLVVPGVVGGRRLRDSRVLRVIFLVAVAAQIFLVAYFGERTEAFELIAGRQSEEEYLTKVRPSYTTIQQIDALLPADSRTLIVGLNETYWFEHRVRGGGNFDGPRMSAYLGLPTAEALYARLKHDGITHVAIVGLATPTQVAAKMEERDTTLAPEAQRALAQMLDHYGSNITARGNATVFTLR